MMFKEIKRSAQGPELECTTIYLKNVILKLCALRLRFPEQTIQLKPEDHGIVVGNANPSTWLVEAGGS